MSAFLENYLEQRLPIVLRKRTPDLYFDNGTYCPQLGDLEVGAETVSVEIVQHYGQAAIMSGVAQDVPMSEVSINKDVYRVVQVVGASSFSDPEVRAGELAAKNGQRVTSIKDERIFGMRKMIDERSHLLCAYGSAAHGMYGVLNHPEVPISNTSSYKIYAGNATVENILDFFSSEYYAGWTSTNFVEMPNVLYVSPKTFEKLNSTFRSNTTGDTLADSIRKILPSIQQIVPMRELASANLEANGVLNSGTNKDRAVFANLSVDNYCRHFTPLYVMPPVQQGVKYNVIAYKAVSSVQFDYPKTARYIDYPIATTNN